MAGLDERIVEEYQDRRVNLIQRFDRIIFNLDLIKSIIHWDNSMNVDRGEGRVKLMTNLNKYGKEYGMHKWTRLPEPDEAFQIRKRYVLKDDRLFFTPCPTKYTKIEDKKMALTNCACWGGLIQRIFWYDEGNGRIDGNGYHYGWKNSKCNGMVFLSQVFNTEIFKDYNWIYYFNFITVPKNSNKAVILPYNKQKLNEMGLNLD